jgi:hypothetical protein
MDLEGRKLYYFAFLRKALLSFELATTEMVLRDNYFQTWNNGTKTR